MFVDKRLSEEDPSEVKDLAEGDVHHQQQCQSHVNEESVVLQHRCGPGTLEGGERKTYGSGCSACGDTAVTGHTPGACED